MHKDLIHPRLKESDISPSVTFITSLTCIATLPTLLNWKLDDGTKGDHRITISPETSREDNYLADKNGAFLGGEVFHNARHGRKNYLVFPNFDIGKEAHTKLPDLG